MPEDQEKDQEQHRVQIGIRLAPATEVSAWLTEGAAFDAGGADALWLDALWHDASEHDPHVLAAAMAAVTYRSILIVDLPDGDERTARTLDAVSRGRVRTHEEQWEDVEFPESRQAWREALVSAAERGVRGLVLAADPRLLDLLRNPDADIDRRDLQLAAG
jgi:hypothetical protein